MSLFGKWYSVLLAIIVMIAALTGCSPDQGMQDEEKESHYMEGKGLVNAMNYDGAIKAFEESLEANPHYGKTILGRVRRRVENLAGTAPGSLEEALVYAQTYGDVWTEPAKAFLEKALDERAATPAAPAAEETASP